MEIEITTVFDSGLMCAELEEMANGTSIGAYAAALWKADDTVTSVEIIDLNNHTKHLCDGDEYFGMPIVIDLTIEHQVEIANVIAFDIPDSQDRVCRFIRGKWCGPVGQVYTADDMITQIRAHDCQVKLTRVVTEVIGIHNVI